MFVLKSIVLVSIFAMASTSNIPSMIPGVVRMKDCQTAKNDFNCFGMKFGSQDFFMAGEMGSCFKALDCDFFLVAEKTPSHNEYAAYVNAFTNSTTKETDIKLEAFFSTNVHSKEDVLKDVPDNELALELGLVITPGLKPRPFGDCNLHMRIEHAVCNSNGGITTAFQSLSDPEGSTPSNKFTSMTFKSQDKITIDKQSGSDKLKYYMDMSKDQVFLYLRGRLGHPAKNSYTEFARCKMAVVLFPQSTTGEESNVHLDSTSPTTLETKSQTLRPTIPTITATTRGDKAIDVNFPATTSRGKDPEPQAGNKGLTIAIVAIVLLLLFTAGATTYYLLLARKKKTTSSDAEVRTGN